jgi:CubicO group peptidase (beta-lactamase class C family)
MDVPAAASGRVSAAQTRAAPFVADPAGRPNLEPALELAHRFVRDGAVPSIVFGVADARGTVGMHALGAVPSDAAEEGIFFLASLTKAIVATAVMRYVDEGRWDLHAPLARYLHGFEGAGRETITGWHILTHTSGLPDLSLDELRRRRPSYAWLLQDCRARAPRWEPGTRYEYNSTVWVLLAETMASLSGMPFAQALRTRLTEPLGMVDTSFDPRYARRRVQPVSGVDMRNRLVAEVLLRFLARAQLAGGGLFGSLPDLLRLGRSLLPGAVGQRVLSEPAVEAMSTPQTEGIPHIAEDGTETFVGQAVGWRTPAPGWPARPGVITHGGISGSRIWVDRPGGLVFALLTNSWGAPDEPTIALLEAIYGSSSRT